MKMTKKSEQHIRSYLKDIEIDSLKDFKSVFKGGKHSVFTNGYSVYLINNDVELQDIKTEKMEQKHIDLFSRVNDMVGKFEDYQIQIKYDNEEIKELIDDAKRYKQANINRMTIGHKDIDPGFIVQADNILNGLYGVFEKSEEWKDWILLTGKYGYCYMLPLNPKNFD